MERATSKLRTLAFLLAVMAVFLLHAVDAAALSLKLVSSGGTEVLVNDNQTGDRNSTVGAITYSDPIDSFTVQVTTGISKPVVGGLNLAELDLTSVTTTGSNGGKLTIMLTDDGFFADPALNLSIVSAVGGTSNGIRTYQSFVDTANVPFGTSGCTSGLQGPFSGAFDSTVTALCDYASPFSVTVVTEITLGPNKTDSFGAETIVTPLGEACLGEIGDYVWHDVDRDGIQDLSESGIGGVTLNLLDCDLNPLDTTVTNASGFYKFAELCPGCYKVAVVPPTGYNATTVNAQGSTPANDSNPNPTQTTLTVDNATDYTLDFGFWKPSATGTGTPGYWKNHPEAWPVDQITIGGVTYTKAQAIEIMGLPDGDKTITMFRSLVAAKLNVLIGNEDSCIEDTIASADTWLAAYPVGSEVGGKSMPWKLGEPLYLMLDDYNNGKLCAPSRDYNGDPHPTLCPPQTTPTTGGGGKRK